MNAFHLKADGSTVEIAPANGKDFSLKELQDYVGGHIETVPAKNPDPASQASWILVADEDGLSKNLPINAHATTVVDPRYLFPGMYIAGDVVWCPRRMLK